MAGLPEIKPYPMPTAADLPPSTPQWRVDPRRAVLLVHDLQRYFLRAFPQGESPVVDLVRNAALLRERCAALGMPVAYTAQPGSMTEAQRGLLADFWGPGMTATPADRAVVDPVAPSGSDWMLTKWRYSAFHKSDLAERMRATGRDQLVICGVYAHVGVLMTACDAFTQDIQPFLVADAVADFSPEYHRLALDYAAARCALVTTTQGVLAELTLEVAA
ncbi:MAG TPA: isochorismatase family protein [Actinophytocola sp.]|jgi:isochorismate hydrolase|uniref:isochorismatase family protein n=1 Tax=Actinophytocola sp. TaxID=1872138 RepID=UPI002F93F166